jgi:catechol 2,3-dioxygenase-like lactoylglutathione lyase family enzyme
VIDRGLTHIALPVREMDASLAFYEKYADLRVVHERNDGGVRVAWVSDGTRPFVVVLIEVPEVRNPLLPLAHLGVGVESRERVDQLVAEAEAERRTSYGPIDAGYPVGYWALISDPDDHTLEVSYGQEVGLAVETARREAGDPSAADAGPTGTRNP